MAPTSSTIAEADDVDPSLEGIQIDIQVDSRRMDPGTPVRVFLDASATDGSPDGESIIGADGTSTVRVTLPAGELELAICDADCSTQLTFQLTVEGSIGGGCDAIDLTWITPSEGPDGSGAVVGEADDVDGDGCTGGVSIGFRVSTNAEAGQTASLIVNETVADQQEISGSVIDFAASALASGPNTVEVRIGTGDDACVFPFTGGVEADCDTPRCVITAPETLDGFLAMADDADTDDDGLQVQFQAQTDATAVGRDIEFIIDGNSLTPPTGSVVADGEFGTATSPVVTLAEGAHTVQARCTAASGNTDISAVVDYEVDITACGVAITDPTAGQTLGDASDEDGATDGIQYTLAGTATGDDCASVRFAECDSLDSASASNLTSDSFGGQITVGTTTGAHQICAEVTDEAGNVGSVEVEVEVRSDLPSVAFVSPTAGTRFNRAGGMFAGQDYTGDLNTGTAVCDFAVVVDCSEVGDDVTLTETVTGQTLGTATCVASAMSAFDGRAMFASVALPNAGGVTDFTLAASQELGGVGTGTAQVAVSGDCQAPTLTVVSPICGSTVDPDDDEDTGTAGVQLDVRVQYAPATPAFDVTVNILDSANAGQDTDTQTTPGTGLVVFQDMTFGSAGDFTVVASGADDFGNAATSAADCTVTVEDQAVVTITSPAPNTTYAAEALGDGTDCNLGAAGLDITVSGTTDVAAGNTVRVTVNGGTEATTTVAAGAPSNTFTVCAPAAEGTGNVVVVVEDATRGDGMAQVPVVVDTEGPAGAIDDLAVVIDDARAGDVTFNFTAVADADGSSPLARYELACADTPITNQTEWDAAERTSLLQTPSAPSTGDSIVRMAAFRTGVIKRCLVRGFDSAGNGTPFSASDSSAEVHPAFRTMRLTAGAGANQLGLEAETVGDVNGDGVTDFLVGGNDRVFLYYGASGGTLPDTKSPDAVFIPGGTFNAVGGGFQFAGLGDVNGDGVDDLGFASQTNARVTIVLGRDADDVAHPAPFSGGVIVDLTGACLDVCFDIPAAFFAGYHLRAAGDFDGDGRADLAVSSPFTDDTAYILLGQAGFSHSAANSIAVPGDDPPGFVLTSPTAGTSGFGFLMAAYDANVAVAATRSALYVGATCQGTTTGCVSDGDTVIYRLPGRAAAAGLTTLQAGTDFSAVLTIAGPNHCLAQDTRTFTVTDFQGDGQVDIVCHDVGMVDTSVYTADGAGAFSAARTVSVVAATAAATDVFGRSLGFGLHPAHGRIGDLDDDGMLEILGGDQEVAANRTAGASLVYGRDVDSGTVARNTGASADFRADGANDTTDGSHAGFVGDVNGDGYPDIVVGDPVATGGVGAAVVYY